MYEMTAGPSPKQSQITFIQNAISAQKTDQNWNVQSASSLKMQIGSVKSGTIFIHFTMWILHHGEQTSVEHRKLQGQNR